MITLDRHDRNPILLPSSKNPWETEAAFNGCVIKDGDTFHMVYRAQSTKQAIQGNMLEVSTVGYANSLDGVTFSNHRQLIKPEEPWEMYGCEDPRITKLDDTYYIFYTALSNFPFNADGIKVAVATTKDLQKIETKHLVTPFNAKAMSLFPEKINGKFTAILTANTDRPPSKIGIAYFDTPEQIWSVDFWNNWYTHLDGHSLPLQRTNDDQVEIGAPPVKTDRGWLLIYCYIRNYFSDQKIFGIEAVLLDHDNPQHVIARIDKPLLTPGMQYELYGHVPDVIFPSGALIDGKTLYVYYGAADTTCAVATCDIDRLMSELLPANAPSASAISLERFSENPILTPLKEHAWEAKAAFNPAAVLLDGKFHLLYRAMSDSNVSVLGYAQSEDGLHITNRLTEPVYVPREVFEKNTKNANSGCEDPRLTIVDDRIYMTYTAYDGVNPPRVALTSISVAHFLKHSWHWGIPKLISPPEIDDKDACILPKQINGKYMIFHRLEASIWIDFVDDLHFYEGTYLGGNILLQARPNMWDSAKVGIAAPPLETEKGWILLYHGITKDHEYKVGAALLDLADPSKVLSRLDEPIFSPEMPYERQGQVGNVVFPCGAVVKDNTIFIYYGGGDSVTGVATIALPKLLDALTK